MYKNIAIPIITFSKSGGMRVLENLANKWIEYGESVTFIVADNSDPYFPTKAKIKRLNVKRNSTLKEILVLSRYLRKNYADYDAVIANGHVSAYPVYISSIFKNRKKIFYYIQAYETGFYDEMKPGVKKKLRQLGTDLTYKFKFKQIVNAEIYCSYPQLKSKEVVPPGLDLELYYHKTTDRYWNVERSLTIGHIGRTQEWKGSKDVADAVKILQDEGVNIEYKVAFNPPKEGSCDFELVKPDGDNNLAEYYRAVDVLVAPGHIQLGAIHYPVIEAMACGTPVITTGYYPATDENAYIVGVKSPREIADAIKSIMSDYSLAMCKVEKASQEIEAFSWDNVSKKMLKIIEENIK